MNGWAPDGKFEPHEAPIVPEFVGTDMSVANGEIRVNRWQDVEPILERCKELARSDQFRSPSNEMHHAAEFPNVVVEQYIKSKGITYEEFMNNPVHVKAMMADPALSHFLIAKNATHKSFR